MIKCARSLKAFQNHHMSVSVLLSVCIGEVLIHKLFPSGPKINVFEIIVALWSGHISLARIPAITFCMPAENTTAGNSDLNNHSIPFLIVRGSMSLSDR